MATTARVGGLSTSFIGGRPRWEDVYNAYRAEDTNDGVFLQKYFHRYAYSQELGEHSIADMRIEPGAARISIALIKSDMKGKFKNTKIRNTSNDRDVNIGIEITKAPKGEEWIKGYRVIDSAVHLHIWLSQNEEDGGAGWGNEVSFTGTRWGEVAIPGFIAVNGRIMAWAENRNERLPCNGIFIMIAPQSERWESSATLWIGAKQDVINGTVNVPNTAFRSNFTVHFWMLRDGHPNKCGREIHAPNMVCTKVMCHPCPKTNIHKKLGCCHVIEIRNKINNAPNKLHGIDRRHQKLGEMLKKLWDRYENRLVIHCIDYSDDERARFEYTDSTEIEPGVFIDINQGMNKLKGNYHGFKPYEVIIHEFFHNIDYLIAQDIAPLNNGPHQTEEQYNRDTRRLYRAEHFVRDNRSTYGIPADKVDYPCFYGYLIKDFGETISSEVKALDIETVTNIYISPNASLIYIVCGGRYNVDEGESELELERGFARIYGPSIPQQGESPYWIKSPLTNKNVMNKHRVSEPEAPHEYEFNLSSEAFANMAAAATANLDTFIEIAKILPQSCEYFIKMLEKTYKMLEELDK